METIINDYPCKDCSERHVGCHSECESYQRAIAESNKKKKEVSLKKIELYGSRATKEAKVKRSSAIRKASRAYS